MKTRKQESYARITDFQRRVFAALLRVPRGRVTTYKCLAEALGCRSCRAVAQALKRNPYAPRIPCHRVIASDLTPGGFMGSKTAKALEKKLDLLAEEGVFFTGGFLADIGRLTGKTSGKRGTNCKKPTLFDSSRQRP